MCEAQTLDLYAEPQKLRLSWHPEFSGMKHDS
jgi:hypothetical protein